MKRQVMYEHIKTIILAILCSVVLSSVICFLLFLNDRSVDSDLPQYLIHSINAEITFEYGNISLSEEGIERLNHHDLWLITLSQDGMPLYSYNAPTELVHRYSGSDLVKLTIRTNDEAGYTQCHSIKDDMRLTQYL